jgi:hypothetical protein
MTPRGRPTTGVKVQVRIPADLLATIDETAADLRCTRAELIRRWLQGHRRLHLTPEPRRPPVD